MAAFVADGGVLVVVEVTAVHLGAMASAVDTLVQRVAATSPAKTCTQTTRDLMVLDHTQAVGAEVEVERSVCGI